MAIRSRRTAPPLPACPFRPDRGLKSRTCARYDYQVARTLADGDASPARRRDTSVMTTERPGTTATLPEAVDPAASPGRWRALAVSQMAAFMALFEVSIVNVAPCLDRRDLSTSAAIAQWVVSGYGLALGLTLIQAGHLGDSFGRCMFLIGLSAFVLTSVFTGLAPSAGLLIAARLLQGSAAA